MSTRLVEYGELYLYLNRIYDSQESMATTTLRELLTNHIQIDTG